jgi:release factor glutamine methyltransferase
MLLDVIQRSAEFLAKRGVDSPRLQTELLVAYVLKMPRMKLYLNFDRTLTAAELQTLRVLVQRRGRREPLQQITGSTCFCGLELSVNRDVLIPRPETELLAELGWQFLNQISAENQNSTPDVLYRGAGGSNPAALDFGTGSGCLAIALAVHCPTVTVEAVDVSDLAIRLAMKNARSHGVSDRVPFSAGDGFSPLPIGAAFDLIVSNPPYIATALIDSLQPEVRDHDPRQALDGGPDGLSFYRRLAVEAGPFLKPHGKMMLEFGDGQADSISKVFENQNWIVERVVSDYTQQPRILIVRRTH